MEIKPSNPQRAEINPASAAPSGQVKQQEGKTAPEIKKSEPKPQPPLESTALSPEAQTTLDNRKEFTNFLKEQGINDINDEKSVKALIENLKKTDPKKSKGLEDMIKKFQAGDITNKEFEQFFKDFGIKQESSLASFGLGLPPMGMPQMPLPSTPMGAGTLPLSGDFSKIKDIFKKKDSVGSKTGETSKDSPTPKEIINKEDTNKEALDKVKQKTNDLNGKLKTKSAELKGNYDKELEAIKEGTDTDVKNAVEIKGNEINNKYGDEKGEIGSIGTQNKKIQESDQKINDSNKEIEKQNEIKSQAEQVKPEYDENGEIINQAEVDKSKEDIENAQNEINKANETKKEAEGKKKEAQEEKTKLISERDKAFRELNTEEGRNKAIKEVVGRRNDEVQAKIRDLDGAFEHPANAELKELDDEIKNLESQKAPLEAKINQGEGDKKVSQNDLQNLGEIAGPAISGQTSLEKEEADKFDSNKLLGILQSIQQAAGQNAQLQQAGVVNPQSSLQPLQNYMNQYGTQMSKDVREGMEKILKGNMDGLNKAIKSMQEMSKPAKNSVAGLSFNLPENKLNLANLFAMNGSKSASEPGSTLNIVSPPPTSQNSETPPSLPPKTA